MGTKNQTTTKTTTQQAQLQMSVFYVRQPPYYVVLQFSVCHIGGWNSPNYA